MLRNCRSVIQGDGRVLIAGFALNTANQPDFGRLIDIEMLSCCGLRAALHNRTRCALRINLTSIPHLS